MLPFTLGMRYKRKGGIFMKKIAVVGLGIIGGSICGALTKAGYQVDGFTRSRSSIDYALQAGFANIKVLSVKTDRAVFLPAVIREVCAVAMQMFFKF